MLYRLILAAVAAACVCGCADMQVVYRVSFTHQGQTVGICYKNNEVELSTDLTR